MNLTIFCIFLLIDIVVCSDDEQIMNSDEFGENGLVHHNEAVDPTDRVETNFLEKPRIYELYNVTSSVGSDVRIICKANGRPSPKVTFRKFSNVEVYRPGIQYNDSRIVLEQEFFEDEAFGTLIISKIVRSDDGLYKCIAENPAGNDYKNGHVIVWFKPTFNGIKDLRPVYSWDGRPANLTCLPEAIPNATIVWRWNHLEITEENFNNGRLHHNNFQVIQRSPQSVLIVKPYNTQALYSNYECIARNPLGEASINIELKRGSIPTYVIQARALTVTATTITFEIVLPSNLDGLPIRTYTVQYKPEQQPSWDNSLTDTWSYGSPYTIEHLIPEVTYHFRFAAEDDVGMGAWTNVQSQTMKRVAEPAEPTILLPSYIRTLSGRQELNSPDPNNYELQWNMPADNGEPIEYYLVRYCSMERINSDYRDRKCSKNIHQSAQYTNFQLERLMPDTMYKVELRAHNAIGDSSPAQVWVRTARGERPLPGGSEVMCANFIFVFVFVLSICFF